MRIGQGIDIHAFAEGRPLILGGVEIPHPRGLAGHSDGDVLLHAIIDALLGAAALGDIGGMFPSSDQRWAGADSRDLLALACKRVRAAGLPPRERRRHGRRAGAAAGAARGGDARA